MYSLKNYKSSFSVSGPDGFFCFCFIKSGYYKTASTKQPVSASSVVASTPSKNAFSMNYISAYCTGSVIDTPRKTFASTIEIFPFPSFSTHLRLGKPAFLLVIRIQLQRTVHGCRCFLLLFNFHKIYSDKYTQVKRQKRRSKAYVLIESFSNFYKTAAKKMVSDSHKSIRKISPSLMSNFSVIFYVLVKSLRLGKPHVEFEEQLSFLSSFGGFD